MILIKEELRALLLVILSLGGSGAALLPVAHCGRPSPAAAA